MQPLAETVTFAAHHLRRAATLSGLVAAMLVVSAVTARAHEIPSRVSAIVYVKPTGSRLQILVRAPLGAMRDMDFPLKGAGYLDVDRAQQHFRDAAQLWLADYIHLFQDGRQLEGGQVVSARASLPSDRAFAEFATALAHVNGPPLGSDTEIPWQQAMLDVLLEYPITSESAQFAIEPFLAQLGLQTTTVLRFLPAGGSERVFQYTGDPGRVELDPGFWHAAWRFVALGFRHILDGVDHLLFLLCLVIPVRRVRPLIGIVTAFTAAHSVTLIASASGFAPDALWFPPLIETLIALSILLMAFENILGAHLERRWMLAFGFGLIHGFGFSFALRESLQFAGSHLLTSLLSFNVGVELGQLLVVAVAVPVLSLTFRRVANERMVTILLSALVAHTAWHWMTERGATLREYEWSLSAADATSGAGLMRLAMLALIVGVVAWGTRALIRRVGGATTPDPDVLQNIQPSQP